jgi:hypothetical protein
VKKKKPTSIVFKLINERKVKNTNYNFQKEKTKFIINGMFLFFWVGHKWNVSLEEKKRKRKISFMILCICTPCTTVGS